MKSLFKYINFALIICFTISSCVNTRQAIYFNGVNDGTINANTSIPESIIQLNDVLSINVSDINPEAAQAYNSPSNNSTSGYLVNANGTIQFPILGSIKAIGLTKDQLRDSITRKLIQRKLLLDPIVSIRFLSFHVTVLGEVNHPSDINVPNEKISLLEAIGLAGDLTIYARRDNVMIVREENGNKVIKRLDLNSNELLTSSYYYLKSNDLVYVEPNKSRVASAGRGQQWVPAVLSGLSLIAIVVDRLVK